MKKLTRGEFAALILQKKPCAILPNETTISVGLDEAMSWYDQSLANGGYCHCTIGFTWIGYKSPTAEFAEWYQIGGSN
jgi:hypothetical protein